MPAGHSLDRGTRVTITRGKYAGCGAIIEANVFGYSVNYPEERADGFQVPVLVGGKRVWATVRVGQVRV